MGLLNKLFGGGTKLDLTLDAAQIPAGGVLSGRLTLHGGKKALTLTSLKVRLVYFLVKSKEGSSLPEIDTRVILDQTLASGEDLPAETVRDYEFRFQIDKDTAPSGDGVSYKVMAAADIPKVADPTAEATFTITEGAGMDLDVLTLDDAYARWPNLQSDDEEELVDGLRDVHLACYSERENLQVLEPILAGHIRSGTTEVRKQALEAWANLLDGFVRKEHLKLLNELAAQRTMDRDFLREVITAAAKFADEGALPLIKELARSPDPEVREEVAQQLRFAASDKFKGKLDLLQSMAADPVDTVRAAVIGAYSDYRDNKKVMAWVAEQIGKDPSPKVQAACVSTLALLHHHGQGALTLQVYERCLGSEHQEVRKELTENLQWLGEENEAAIRRLAERLLADRDPEIRRSMAWQFVNLRDFPGLAPLVHRAAADPDPKVRADALFGMSSVTEAPQLVAIYRQRLGEEPTESIHWGVISGLRDHSETTEGQALLQELTRSPMSDIARSARELLGAE
ncbi:MAG: HEAT repeat domain-containing protein [Nannocystaceae bacterium]